MEREIIDHLGFFSTIKEKPPNHCCDTGGVDVRA